MRLWAPTAAANGPSVSAAISGAQCGVAYDARVQLTPGWRVVELRIDPASGLTHDSVIAGRIHGTPRQVGSVRLALRVAHSSGQQQALDVQLNVSPDPRSLWKDLPSDPTARFAKPPRDALQQHAHGIELLAVSCRGRMHANVGGFRDDDVRVGELPGGWLVLIAADGAGSARYSREGSRLAVQCALDSLTRGLQSNPEADPAALLSDAAHTALAAIDALASAQRCPSSDFHTTLLIALSTAQSPQRVVVLQIGDGLIAAIAADGRWSAPLGIADHGDFHGQTRFLSAECLTAVSLSKRIREHRLADVRYLLVATDGITDPYFETDSALADPAQCAGFVHKLQSALQAAAGPLDGLHSWLTEFTPGHHDDRTLAIACWRS
jgi:serine/threonine protein phosphatase PrpC